MDTEFEVDIFDECLSNPGFVILSLSHCGMSHSVITFTLIWRSQPENQKREDCYALKMFI